MKIITPHLSCGPEVTIDIEASSSKDEIKQKLVEATGVPFEHQKVMLSGINQIVMGDKRCDVLKGLVAAAGCVASAAHAPCRAPLHPTIHSLVGRPCWIIYYYQHPSPTRRTNIGFASCGSANGVQMAVNAK